MDAEINITSHVDKTLDELKQAAARALEKAGLTAENYAKLACPVDTGRLRNSISHASDGESAYIGTNVEYAPYVELGYINPDTMRHIPAQPYLRPAVADHADKYRRIIQDEMKNA